MSDQSTLVRPVPFDRFSGTPWPRPGSSPGTPGVPVTPTPPT